MGTQKQVAVQSLYFLLFRDLRVFFGSAAKIRASLTPLGVVVKFIIRLWGSAKTETETAAVELGDFAGARATADVGVYYHQDPAHG